MTTRWRYGELVICSSYSPDRKGHVNAALILDATKAHIISTWMDGTATEDAQRICDVMDKVGDDGWIIERPIFFDGGRIKSWAREQLPEIEEFQEGAFSSYAQYYMRRPVE